MKYINAALAAAALAASSTAVSLNVRFEDEKYHLMEEFSFDAGDDKRMTWNEFIGSRMYRRSRELLFVALDTDGDDTITVKEFEKFLDDAYSASVWDASKDGSPEDISLISLVN